MSPQAETRIWSMFFGVIVSWWTGWYGFCLIWRDLFGSPPPPSANWFLFASGLIALTVVVQGVRLLSRESRERTSFTGAQRFAVVVLILAALAPDGTLLRLLSVLEAASVNSREEVCVELDEATQSNCLAFLYEGLHGSEFWPAMHAAEGLTLGGRGSEVIEFLKPKLATETDDQRRCGLARELARAGDKSGIPVMLAILEGANDFGHVHAAESLFKVYESGDGVALRRGLAQDQNIKLKLMSAGALHRAGDKSAIETIRALLSHENPRHAEVAAWLIGQIGWSMDDIPRLKALLPKQSDPLAKAYFEHALAMLGDPDGQAALVRNLKHPDKAIRTYAANFAADARVTAAVPQLIQMLDDPWIDARIRAAQSLLVLARE